MNTGSVRKDCNAGYEERGPSKRECREIDDDGMRKEELTDAALNVHVLIDLGTHEWRCKL